jgi:alpha-ketoglutarate-dependent taurine dioxygenase
VPDEAVWTYGEAIRAIAVEKDLLHLKFVRLWDLLEHSGSWDKEYYLAHAPCIRRELLYRYGDRDFDAEVVAESNEDVRMTLAGYQKFLRKDLAYDPRLNGLSEVERSLRYQQIAKQMMSRWKAFAAAMEANMGGLVRLSIHDSAGKGKLSMALVPQEKGIMGLTPWHSAVAIELDGSYRTIHTAELTDGYELVRKNGRSFCYRAKSDMFDWSDAGLKVAFEHLYPCGLIIRPEASADGTAPSMTAIPGEKVRKLANTFSPIVMRGFAGTKVEANYRSKADDLGKVLSWTFGEIFKVVDTGEVDKQANNVTSNEAMPMHFDGCFKFVDHTDPETGESVRVLTPPGYQYFTCISTAPQGTGYTLFANSRLFFRYISPPWTLERMEPITWQMENDGFWSNKQTGLPLVKRHPVTEQPCLRWHQSWSETKFSKYKVTIENDDQELEDVISQLVYDHRVCLRFSWNEGDLLVNDNISMLHTRTAYASKCDREMWRIHFD